MKCCDDLIKTMIAAIQHTLGEHSFTENFAEQVEQQLINDFGGDRFIVVERSENVGRYVYISKRETRTRREAVLRDFNGRNREEVCRKHGISKAQFYRMLKGG